MSRFVTLTGLALRELWISFRLLGVVGALLLAGMPAALLPHVLTPDLAGAPPDPLTWLAAALGAALALASGLAAATMATERRRGTAGWMAVRGVGRPTIVLAWFAAFAVLLVVGLVPTALLAWLALGVAVLPAGPLPLAASIAAAGCAGLAGIAVGLLSGSILAPWAAAAATAFPVGAVLVSTALGFSGWSTLPASGIGVLATLDTAARPLADAVRGAGAALATAAVALLLAVMGFDRAEL
ncbi:MAG TPA: hypothetical protein VHK63_09390 [Candidatus Limnocylindria bacterium]|nr:hypothetical protein [Candidatus Limnocylindria bacterium]